MVVLAAFVVIVAGFVALALWPYFGRRRGGAETTPGSGDDSAEKTRRLAIIVIAAVVIGATVIGVRLLTERSLDAREDELRAELDAAGPARLEDLRVLSLGSGDGLELVAVFDEITSNARLRGWSTSSRLEGEAAVDVEVAWFASARCFRVLIAPGGQHLVVPDDC